MSVYVDNARIPYGRMLMSHMVADTLDELHAMAAALGLRRAWFQNKVRWPHYDVCAATRERALKLGAVPVTGRQLIERLRAASLVAGAGPYDPSGRVRSPGGPP